MYQKPAPKRGAVPVPIDEMFSIREAAQYIGVSYGLLKEWRRTNRVRIPSYKHGDGRTAKVTYRKSDLDAYLSRVRQEA